MDVFAIWFYTLVGAAFIFAACYSGIVWVQVRGLRGLMMILLCVGIAVNVFTVVLFQAGFRARLDVPVTIAVSRAALAVSSIAALVSADLYAASRNNHRALTTILYLFFIRLTEERKHG